MAFLDQNTLKRFPKRSYNQVDSPLSTEEYAPNSKVRCTRDAEVQPQGPLPMGQLKNLFSNCSTKQECEGTKVVKDTNPTEGRTEQEQNCAIFSSLQKIKTEAVQHRNSEQSSGWAFLCANTPFYYYSNVPWIAINNNQMKQAQFGLVQEPSCSNYAFGGRIQLNRRVGFDMQDPIQNSPQSPRNTEDSSNSSDDQLSTDSSQNPCNTEDPYFSDIKDDSSPEFLPHLPQSTCFYASDTNSPRRAENLNYPEANYGKPLRESIPDSPQSPDNDHSHFPDAVGDHCMPLTNEDQQYSPQSPRNTHNLHPPNVHTNHFHFGMSATGDQPLPYSAQRPSNPEHTFDNTITNESSYYCLRSGNFCISMPIYPIASEKVNMLCEMFRQQTFKTKEMSFGIDDIEFMNDGSNSSYNHFERFPDDRETSNYWFSSGDLVITCFGEYMSREKILRLFKFFKANVDETSVLRFGINDVEFSHIHDFWSDPIEPK